MTTTPRTHLPKDFAIQARGNTFTMQATIATQQELATVIWAVKLLNSTLPSHRIALAGDFGIPETPPLTLRDEMVLAGLIPLKEPTP